MPTLDQIKEFHVAKLQLPPRTEKVLKKAGIQTVGQILPLTAEDIRKLPSADRFTPAMTEVTLRHKGAQWGVELSLARPTTERKPRRRSPEEIRERDLRIMNAFFRHDRDL